MSNIQNCNTKNNCKPWRAPDLNISEEVAFDYKLTNPEQISNRSQQTRIRQQAYEKSYAKGYMEGLSQGQREINDQLQHIHSVMAALTMPLPELDDQVVDEMVQLCITIVKHMVRRELKMSPDEVVAVIKEALSMLPATAADVTIALHPEDAKLVRQTSLNPDMQTSWKIVEDLVITRGGCRVQSNSSRIDATVENRLNAVISKVLGDERKQNDAQE